jgi:hypothetical protein
MPKMAQKEKDNKKERHEEKGNVVRVGRGRRWGGGEGMEKENVFGEIIQKIVSLTYLA